MVVLATKVYVEGEARRRALDSLTSLVGDRIGDLELDYEVGVRHDRFPTVTVEGPDAPAARAALREQWGAVEPPYGRGDTVVGTLEGWDERELVVDAGTELRVPADRLGLGPGHPGQIRERFGLVQHLPLRVTLGDAETDPEAGADAGSGSSTDDDPDPGHAGGDDPGDSSDDSEGDGGDAAGSATPRLADAERDRLYEWTRGPGRVNVNSATRSEVRATLNRAGHADDVVRIERLGLLEQSIVTAEGTDPPGLLASVGEYLPAEMLCVVP